MVCLRVGSAKTDVPRTKTSCLDYIPPPTLYALHYYCNAEQKTSSRSLNLYILSSMLPSGKVSLSEAYYHLERIDISYWLIHFLLLQAARLCLQLISFMLPYTSLVFLIYASRVFFAASARTDNNLLLFSPCLYLPLFKRYSKHPHDLGDSRVMLMPRCHRLSSGKPGMGHFPVDFRTIFAPAQPDFPCRYNLIFFKFFHPLVGWRSGHRVSFTFVCFWHAFLFTEKVVGSTPTPIMFLSAYEAVI